MEVGRAYTCISYTRTNEMSPAYHTLNCMHPTALHSPPPTGMIEQYQGQYKYLQESLDPWLFDSSACGTPISTDSPISPPDDITTTASISTLPPPNVMDQHIRPCQASAYNYTSTDTHYEGNWSYSDAHAWNAQHWPSTSQPCQQPMDSRVASLLDTPIPYTSYSLPDHLGQNVVAEPYHDSQNNDDLGQTSDENDDESEVSDYEEQNSMYGKHGTVTKIGGTPGVQKHGKWGKDSQAYTIPESRNYCCTKLNSKGEHCGHKFTRPEHLRRHMNSSSSHGGRRPHYCKVPNCITKPFSRGDNLRDHYWTHLERGGRTGKNKKYTFQELKVMLGPKEKKLIRRLKEKLVKHRAEKLATQQKADRRVLQEREYFARL